MTRPKIRRLPVVEEPPDLSSPIAAPSIASCPQCDVVIGTGAWTSCGRCSLCCDPQRWESGGCCSCGPVTRAEHEAATARVQALEKQVAALLRVRDRFSSALEAAAIWYHEKTALAKAEFLSELVKNRMACARCGGPYQQSVRNVGILCWRCCEENYARG